MRCPVSDYMPAATTHDERIAEGQRLTFANRWPDARAVYLTLLSSSRQDSEALYGLARIDAWEGCWRLSEREYRSALGAHPEDDDVRAGFADLLVWQGRSDEAEALLREGLARRPKSPPLLARKAQILYRQGDATQAARLADEAAAYAPDDPDLRDMRNAMTLGEGRITVRYDRYPGGYQDIEWWTAQAMQRIGRFEISAGAQILHRPGLPDVAAQTDGRYPVSVAYHPSTATLIGLEVTPGGPATTIPDIAVRAFGVAPITPFLGSFLSAAFWHYDSGQTVETLAPSIGFQVLPRLRLDARGWLSLVHLPSTATSDASTTPAAAVGGLVAWNARPDLELDVTYTYGAELDANPALTALDTYRSHVASAYADWTFHARPVFGLRPVVTFEDRFGGSATIQIVSFELGGYLRW